MSKIVVDSIPRLLGFKLEHPPFQAGPRQLTSGAVWCYRADPSIEGWSIELRGAAAFLVSPRGWTQNTHHTQLPGKGPVTVIGPIAMAQVTCVWEGDDAAIVDKVQRFTSPPFTRAAPPPSEDARIDPKEIGDA